MGRKRAGVLVVLLAAAIGGALVRREEVPEAPQVVGEARPEAATAAGPPELEVAKTSDAVALAVPASADGATSDDAGVPDDGCEIVDGEPSRAEAGSVTVIISAGAAVAGTLTVRYQGPDGAFITPDGVLQGTSLRTARISRERVTLLRCGDRIPIFDVHLDDGRVGRARAPEDGGAVRIRPFRAAHVRGRLVSDEGPLAEAVIEASLDAWANSGADGRFELVFLPTTAENWADFRIRKWDDRGPWKLAAPVAAFRYGPGTSLDLGDIRVKRGSRVEAGKVGIGWNDSEGPPVVVMMLAGGPAARAGIQKGDEVVEVDGVAIATVDEAMKLIPGDAGTPVRLKIRRGAEYLLFDMVRQGAD